MPRRRAALTNSSRSSCGTGRRRTGPASRKSDIEIIAELHLRLRALYAKEGGTFPDPIVKLDVDLHASRAIPIRRRC